ncbi:S-adenosyl-L-methionine-dependent methyltransferase [Mycena polygramma]|nr:S-adenosyl-L-methionine-dependent methyltransferase [Mycena polygramma]
MKLSAAFGLVSDLRAAFGVATVPTLKAIANRPSLVLRPTLLSRTFMAAVWAAFAAPTDEGARPAKLTLIPHATGAVLDIGAGHGHSIGYFDRKAVTAYIALEPNALMHDAIRARAEAAGFCEADGTLLILKGCGAEDTAAIRAQLDGAGLRVDTMLSIMTLCSIPDPQRTLDRLVREVLAPGGRLLFYEHVLSPRADVAWWQRFWTPLWRLAFDGCSLDRPTHLWIDAMKDEGPGGENIDMWSQRQVWGKVGEPDEHLFWHRVGNFVKHSD